MGGETVSVVVTVRDERISVGVLLESLAAQTRRPDEIVVVDGGSRDGTLEALHARARTGDLPLRVLSRPGANISAGRNAAIAAAGGPLIAVTDAGVRLDPDWLGRLLEPMMAGDKFVAGFFASEPRGAFETALVATTLPEVADVDARGFLPSSRSVAFRKEDWAAVGGYPEWLDYCEDLVFDLRLRAVAGPPAFTPGAVAHFRPRPGPDAFARQYYRYARGDGKAGLWPWRHAVRYLTYLVMGPVLLCLTFLDGPRWLLPLLLGGGAMVARPYRRLRRQWGHLTGPEKARAVAWVPMVRVIGDLAKMVGYPVGVVWRRRHRPPEWRPGREEVCP